MPESYNPDIRNRYNFHEREQHLLHDGELTEVGELYGRMHGELQEHPVSLARDIVESSTRLNINESQALAHVALHEVVLTDESAPHPAQWQPDEMTPFEADWHS